MSCGSMFLPFCLFLFLSSLVEKAREPCHSVVFIVAYVCVGTESTLVV